MTRERSRPVSAGGGERSSRIGPASAAIVALIVAVAAFAYRYLSFTRFNNDHFVHLSTAQQIMLGAWPVRDYAERGLPLMSLVSAASQIVLGPGLKSELILVAAAFALAAAAAVLAAYAASGSVLLAATLAIASVLITPVSYAYPKVLLYGVALVAAALYSKTPTTGRAALLGALAGIAFLFRHDHGLIIAAAALALMAVRHAISVIALRAAAIVAVVALLVISPYVAWVATHEGIGAYVSEGVRFSEREADRSQLRGLPRFSVDRSKPLFRPLGHGPAVRVRWRTGLSDALIAAGEMRHRLTRVEAAGPFTWNYELRSWSRGALRSLVRDPDAADTDGIDRSAFRVQGEQPPLAYRLLVGLTGPGEGLRSRENAVAAAFYLAWALPLACLAVLVTRRQSLPPVVLGTAATAIALQLAMDLTMLRDPLETRVRDVVVPLCVLLAFLLGNLWNARVNLFVRVGGRALTVAIALAVAIACGAIGSASEVLERSGMSLGWTEMGARLRAVNDNLAPPFERIGRRQTPYVVTISSYLRSCTAHHSRIFSLTFAPEVFFYSGRGFAGGQVAMTPGYYATDTDAALMLSRLQREDVPIVLMGNESETEMAQHYPRVVDFVRRHYHEIARVPISGTKQFILFGQNGRVVPREFGPAHWPCYVLA